MMQWVDDRQSTYGCRLVCTGANIDEAMEEQYFKFHNGTCDLDHPSFDIERFIDDDLRKNGIEYEPEADLPINVLGATEFNPDGSRLIRISARLYRERNSSPKKGRFRFTCAHESFHAMFHDRLFRRGGHLVCSEGHIREDIIEPPCTQGDFTEWQANRGAAALLMPCSIFTESVKRIRAVSRGVSLDVLIEGLATRFDVSKRSARIRLQTLRLMVPPDDGFVLEYDGIDSYRDNRKK